MIIKTVIRIFSLIFVFSNEWLLTASHCVDGTNAAEIQVGYFLEINNKGVMITIVIIIVIIILALFMIISGPTRLLVYMYVCMSYNRCSWVNTTTWTATNQ